MSYRIRVERIDGLATEPRPGDRELTNYASNHAMEYVRRAIRDLASAQPGEFREFTSHEDGSGECEPDQLLYEPAEH